MSDWLRNKIGGPREAHNVSSALEYLALGLRLCKCITRVDEAKIAYVSDSRWVVDCICGNCPSTSPEIGIAVCLECGNVYEPMFPENWQAAEQVLLARGEWSTRHFFPAGAKSGIAETIADLEADNAAREVK